MPDVIDGLPKGLLGEINGSGYPFQHAVVQAFQRSASMEGGWAVQSTEVPVSYSGGSTHIDLIAWWGRHLLLIAECKRANPAFSNWLFLRSPYTFQPRDHCGMWFERLNAPAPERMVPNVEALPVSPRAVPWHVALEVKTDAQGDAKGQGRTLAEAIKQVQQGANGMISLLATQRRILEDARQVIVFPAIFTTARLFTSDARLNMADLKTGRIESLENTEQPPWLWFENNVSPVLLAEIQRIGQDDVRTLLELLENRYTRGMAIVTADGIPSFLESAADVFLPHLPRW